MSFRGDGPLYAGFDLGTTNSAAAAFDGDKLSVIRNASGAALTPSVVRIDSQGRVTVGARAVRFLDRDSENTRAEFKRLMGTDKDLEFPAARQRKKPQELAAEVLRAMRADMQDQTGVCPERAVISVPALFELPQNTATSEAARLAGFEQVELLQEPIASALAAGWSKDDGGGSWLVYDLGGGTFDVSLLETRDGLLRVVGHDGDNFLGGRDFDNALVDWAIARLSQSKNIEISRSNPDHAPLLRTLKRAAEETKIELSRASSAVLSVQEALVVDGVEVEVDIEVERATLEDICAPIIERTMTVCARLLEANGIRDGQLSTIVLVGGPTVMPYLRARVGERLAADVSEGHDPMTLVAQGAAVYAATAGLDARPPKPVRTDGQRLWLQYPPVSSDLTPHIVGKLVGKHDPRPVTIRLERLDGEWTSPDFAIDEEGAFVGMADLVPRSPNVFAIKAVDENGSDVIVSPDSFTIVQGLTITDPPLSRTIGVALADDTVRVYFERGAPLPARRTFMHHTVEGVAKGSGESVLKIPMVQGEFEAAHLCRLIGTLEIPGDEITENVPTGSEIEVTLELDRGGRLSASALVPALEQTFDSVAHLLVPNADPEVLDTSVNDVRRRIDTMRSEAFRQGSTRVIERLAGATNGLSEIVAGIEAARGGDEDAGQKARRSLIELDASLADIELEGKWPELESSARDDMMFATEWVGRYGSRAEKQLLDEVAQAVTRAKDARNIGELQRQLRLARRLGSSAFYRHPEAWVWMFESAASEVHSATNLPEAQRLVRVGRDAVARNDTPTVRQVTEGLWRLLPSDVKDKRLSFDSGVR